MTAKLSWCVQIYDLVKLNNELIKLDLELEMI